MRKMNGTLVCRYYDLAHWERGLNGETLVIDMTGCNVELAVL